MGLDISYCSYIYEDAVQNDEDYDYEYYTYCGPFEYQLGSLKKDTNYKSSDDSEYGSFGAGSYGGYNYWRNSLAVLAGYKDANDVWLNFNNDIRYYKLKEIEGEKIILKPFYEIINFSDAEGCIGPNISEKLYNDFILFDEKAKEQDAYFYRTYCNFKEAFRVASKNGLVQFH